MRNKSEMRQSWGLHEEESYYRLEEVITGGNTGSKN